MEAVKEYLRECGRLLKLVYFQPSTLHTHIKELTLKTADKRDSFDWPQKVWFNTKVIRFLLLSLVTIVVTPFLINLLTGLTISLLGGHFNWTKSFQGNFGGVAVGLVFGGIFGGVLGAKGGVLWGIAAGVAIGVVWSISLGIAFGIALGLALGIAFGIVLSLTLIFAGGITGNSAVNIPGGLAIVIGLIRLPVFVFEVPLAIRAYYNSLSSQSPGQELLHSPVYFDEMMVWPQPYLSSLLSSVIYKNREVGFRQIGKVAGNPFQRWAAQKTLRRLLDKNGGHCPKLS